MEQSPRTYLREKGQPDATMSQLVLHRPQPCTMRASIKGKSKFSHMKLCGVCSSRKTGCFTRTAVPRKWEVHERHRRNGKIVGVFGKKQPAVREHQFANKPCE